MLCLLIFEQRYQHRRNSPKLLLFSMSQWWEVLLGKFSVWIWICPSPHSVSVPTFVCVFQMHWVWKSSGVGGFNSTFSSWCSIREWLRPELCCRISTLCSQWHLVSLWKHYQRNQVTMCLWEILNWTWLVCLLQPDTITKISVVARSCHTKPSFCQRLETASRVLVQELVSPSWQYSIGAHRWWVKPFIGGIQAQAFKSLVTQKCMFNGWLWLTAC